MNWERQCELSVRGSKPDLATGAGGRLRYGFLSRQCKDVPEKPGIYQVLAPKSRWPRGIPRMKGTDPERVLVYGKSTNLNTRAREFLRCLVKPGVHHEANLLYKLNRRASLGVETVFFSWREKPRRKMSAEEVNCIAEYVKRYGEPPPLNSAIPGRKGL